MRALILFLLLIPAAHAAGPVFDADGADAATYGAAQNYPHAHAGPTVPPEGLVFFHSHYDQIRPLRPVPTAAPTSPLARSPAPFEPHWQHAGAPADLDAYLARTPVTGLLIARGDTILYERYRYGRSDQDRFLSRSMAKTITGLLVGLALSEGAIHSIDDLAQTYVPELAGTEYGATPIRFLLRMASGVEFKEIYRPGDDDDKLNQALFARNTQGAVAALRQFNHRIAPPGTRWSYASAETELLGLIVARATHRTLAATLSEKIWQPMGMEADAAWATDATGQEIAYSSFVARLRDWARLALMLAHDGAWNGHQIIPRPWLIDSTTAEPGTPWAVGRIGGIWGYGNQLWLRPGGGGRVFAFRGTHAQMIFIDPATQTVMVQTAAFIQPGGKALDEAYELWNAVLETR